MSFEIVEADASHLPFIAQTFVSLSDSTPAVAKSLAKVSALDNLKFYQGLYRATLDHVRQTKAESVIVALDKSTGLPIAWAHWVLPQPGTDDPSPFLMGKHPPGADAQRLDDLQARYNSSRKEALQGRGQCFLLHQLYTAAEYNGQGAGSLLIRWPIDEADRLGVPVVLGVRRGSDAARLYHSHGFREAASYDVTVEGITTTIMQMIREPNTAGKLDAAILIVSDTASKDPSTDKTEAVLKEVFETEGGGRWNVSTTAILPDDEQRLRKRLLGWTGGLAGPDASPFNLIVTTGGTGFATKDHTPEAVEPLLERKASGLVHLMIASSLQVTPFAAMARPVAGTRGKTLIVTLPGSPKGAKENLQAILKLLPHACQQAAGANSRSLHLGGVKQLEKDAGVSGAMAGSTAAAATGKSGDSGQPGHSHDHSHTHHHHSHGHGGHQGPAGPHTNPSDRPIPNDPSLGPSARHRESPYPKLPVADALDRIFASTPSPTIEERPVSPDLVGYILAEDVTAPHPVPAFRASIVDGYACVTSAETGRNTKGTFPVVSISHAAPGSASQLQPNQLGRITTGAPLPPGASAVVMVEDSVLHRLTADGKEEAEVEILTDQVKDGENVREIGSDIAQGETILRRGARISAVGGELGVLASVGRARVKVFRRPRVGVMSTGDEIVPHDRPGELRHGEVRDTNRVTLMAAIRGWGFEVADLGIVRDKAGMLEVALRDAMQLGGAGGAIGGGTGTGTGTGRRRGVDVIVTTGGVSMGELDLLKPTIERSLGGTIHFGRVAMKPGMPTTFATVPHKSTTPTTSATITTGATGSSTTDNTPGASGTTSGAAQTLIFSLPGNPASGMVTASLFLRPSLDLLSGLPRSRAGPPRVRVVLAEPTRPDRAREEYQRAFVWQEEGGRLRGRTTGMQRSSRIGSFNRANCLLVVRPGAGVLERGQLVEGLLLGTVGLGGDGES